jgi:hypothetical protein
MLRGFVMSADQYPAADGGPAAVVAVAVVLNR